MSDLKIAATQSTPAVVASGHSGIVEMRGDSYPENSLDFFTPIVAWIERYLNESDQPLQLQLHLLYLNTSSVKAMMDVFDLLEEFHRSGRRVSVVWYYDHDNERIAELAAEFTEDCTFPFEVVGLET